MITKKVLVCEDTPESILTAIYDAWALRYGHDNIRIIVQNENCEGQNIELFCEYISVISDVEKTNKVVKSVREKISEEAYDMICHAILSDSADKGDIIYRFLILGFAMGPKVVDHLSNNAVINIFNLNRNVSNEAHHFLGFVRFTDVNNILLSKIHPKNDVLQIIAPHFADRLNTENFVIYDEKRKSAIIHKSGLPWIYSRDIDFNEEKLKQITEEEDEYRVLWKIFFDTIAIEERKNHKLQRNNLPLRFRSNLLEFNQE